MRISDWSSDVCSSDLLDVKARAVRGDQLAQQQRAPVTELGREMAELVPGIGERQRVRALGQFRPRKQPREPVVIRPHQVDAQPFGERARSEEHTSELQSLMRISYAVFCLKKKID